MAEDPGISVPQMNQETALAQEALRDQQPQGHPNRQANHRHEERDADIRAVGLTGAGMGALGIFMFAGLWLLLGLFQRTAARPRVPVSPLALNPPTPAAPRIQDATPQAYQRFLRLEEHTLHSTGPVPAEESLWNGEAAFAAGIQPSTLGPGVFGPEGIQVSEGDRHLPISQAEATLLQQGFPTRPQVGQSAEAGSGKPESLPLRLQPTGAYRADIGPTGKNP